MDGEQITLVNGKYIMEPDNDTHLITATDVADNTVSFRFGIFKTYHVTLPTGAGYTIELVSNETTVRHGEAFNFIVKINSGYSKTEGFKVLVNGDQLDEWDSDTNSASFAIRNVSEDLVITVEGVADITPPEVKVEIRGNSFKAFLNRITFGLFFKETQTVQVKTNDFGSGVKKVEYLLSAKAFTDKDAITGGWTEVKLNDRREAWFGIEPNQKTFVYVRVTDMSDNITVVNTDGVVVYTDAEAFTETMTIKRLDGADASFMVRLNGNAVDAVYNGDTMLADSDYTVAENGVITLKAGYLSTLAAGEYTIRVVYEPMGESFDRGDAPTLVGVVDGDTVQLLCGVLTFDRVTVGKGIGISFTKFALFGDDVTIGNYKLPAADEVGPDDKDGIDRVKKIVDGLTENERAMLGDAAGKPDALIEKIRALADSKNDTPKTGEMSDLALWFALLFVSGGAFAGIRLAGKKKTEAAGHSPGSVWPGKRKPKSDHWRDGRTKSGCPALAPGSERPEKDRRSAEQGLRLALSYVILIISGRSTSKRTTGSATERLLPTLISGVSAGVPIRRDRMEERR